MTFNDVSEILPDLTNTGNVVVVQTDGRGRGVFANRSFRAKEIVVVGLCESIEPRRTSHSIQTGWNQHVLMQEPAVLINHSCKPTTRVRTNRLGAYDFVAIDNIDVGTEITFDYATTETECVVNVACGCGFGTCRGRWGGYRDLPLDNELRRRGFVADYLKVDFNHM
jgi:uncharacterized protein